MECIQCFDKNSCPREPISIVSLLTVHFLSLMLLIPQVLATVGTVNLSYCSCSFRDNNSKKLQCGIRESLLKDYHQSTDHPGQH